MSKNLEKEYRAFVDSEVPDLWSRIEAGLDDKTTADSPVSKSDTDTEPTDLRMMDIHKKWRFRKSSLKIWAGLAAAAACVVLILPAMIRTTRMGGGSSGALDNMAPNYVAQPMEAYDMAEEAHNSSAYIDGAAGGAGEAACEDSVAQVAEAAIDNGENLNSSTTAETGKTNSNVNLDANAVAGNVEDTELNKNSNKSSDNASAPEETGLYCFRVTVEIVDTDVRMNSGILYTAKIITSDNPALQEGSEINIFSPATSPKGVTALEDAKTYELLLRENDAVDSSQETTYVIVEE